MTFNKPVKMRGNIRDVFKTAPDMPLNELIELLDWCIEWVSCPPCFIEHEQRTKKDLWSHQSAKHEMLKEIFKLVDDKTNETVQ